MRATGWFKLSFALALSMVTSTLGAGVYLGTALCSEMSDCFPAAFISDENHTIPPFAITHPPGYTGSGGVLQARICVSLGSESLISPLRRAITTWNNLVATTGNCEGCKIWEEGPTSSTVYHAETTLLHELGHCPLGLEHPIRNWDAQNPPDGFWEPTSFTRSWGVAAPPAGINVGPDFLRGTFDDVQQGAGRLPESVNWFRILDNNPVVVDTTVIDINTYSRAVASNLPAGHSWSANANRKVAESLGFPNTQAVMYALQVGGEKKTRLSADDVAMVKMGMTGRDFLAGTADDYDIELVFVGSCSGPADVIVEYGSLDSGVAGQCGDVGVDFSFSQNPFLARHVTLKPRPGQTITIILNEDLEWDTDPGEPIFADSFESGDLSSWVVGP